MSEIATWAVGRHRVPADEHEPKGCLFRTPAVVRAAWAFEPHREVKGTVSSDGHLIDGCPQCMDLVDRLVGRNGMHAATAMALIKSGRPIALVSPSAPSKLPPPMRTTGLTNAQKATLSLATAAVVAGGGTVARGSSFPGGVASDRLGWRGATDWWEMLRLGTPTVLDKVLLEPLVVLGAPALLLLSLKAGQDGTRWLEALALLSMMGTVIRACSGRPAASCLFWVASVFSLIGMKKLEYDYFRQDPLLWFAPVVLMVAIVVQTGWGRVWRALSRFTSWLPSPWWAILWVSPAMAIGAVGPLGPWNRPVGILCTVVLGILGAGLRDHPEH